jgi:hypothetical protein
MSMDRGKIFYFLQWYACEVQTHFCIRMVGGHVITGTTWIMTPCMHAFISNHVMLIGLLLFVLLCHVYQFFVLFI